MLRPIFDAHLDLAMNALLYGRDLTLPLDELNRREAGMTDDSCRGKATVTLGEMRRAGVATAVVTLLARCGPEHVPKASYGRLDFDWPTPDIAAAAALGQLAYYEQMERAGVARILRTRGEFDAHRARWREADPNLREALRSGLGGYGEHSMPPLGLIVSMEGTDPIVRARDAGWWHQRGLRAAGLAHYGRSRHAGGTSTTAGLSDEGRKLLAEFERLGVLVDATHLSDRAMSEVFDTYGGPMLASHSNCRTVWARRGADGAAACGGQRQISDEQARRIVERGGVIGVVMHAGMLDASWTREAGTAGVTLSTVAEHVDHVCQLAGDAAHVGIGSDLDGGFGTEATPGDVKSIADLAKLADVLGDRGYNDADVEAIFSGNWLRLFAAAMPDR